MAELIASLHAPDGSIAVRGFCDGVEPPTDEERAAAESAAMSDERYEAEMGCPPVGGEAGLTPTERNSFRPTIEVNGIHTGYGGPGSKTVIPASALAKISMRLVPGQRPDEAMACVERHLRQHTPRGMRLFVEDLTGEASWAGDSRRTASIRRTSRTVSSSSSSRWRGRRRYLPCLQGEWLVVGC